MSNIFVACVLNRLGLMSKELAESGQRATVVTEKGGQVEGGFGASSVDLRIRRMLPPVAGC